MIIIKNKYIINVGLGLGEGIFYVVDSNVSWDNCYGYFLKF